MRLTSWLAPSRSRPHLRRQVGRLSRKTQLYLEDLEARAVPAAVRPGFTGNTLAAQDDQPRDFAAIGFSAPINYFGPNYDHLYVNNNGNVTFNSANPTFNPFGLTTTTGTPIIAPFFADVDTRGIGSVTYGNSVVDGHAAFGVTWTNVGYYNQHTSPTNTFQLVLIERFDTGPGNFDIEFNYDKVLWDQGDASPNQPARA